MNRALVDGVVTDELHRAAESAGRRKAPQALVDVVGDPRAAAAVRLGQGCARFAAASRHAGHRHRRAARRRRCGRTGPAGADRRRGRGARPRAGRQDARPAAADRPRRQRPGARSSTGSWRRCRRSKPQLASATWVGGRRWDLNFQSGETVALPEGETAAKAALTKFARLDKAAACSAAGSSASTCAFPAR